MPMEIPEVEPSPAPADAEQSPAVPGQGKAGGPFLAYGGPGGVLLAQEQAEPQATPAEEEPLQNIPEISVPTTDPGDSAPVTEEAPELQGPDEQTEGVGSLANLANSLSGRGFQLYLMVLTFALGVLFYLVIRKVRLERKSK